MTPYKFQNQATQDDWVKFAEEVMPKIKAIGDRVPKMPNPQHQELEELLRYAMEVQFKVAKWLGKMEYFYEIAISESMMEVWEKDTKRSTTMIKAEVDGRVANITSALAVMKYTWKAIETCVMASQSLLKRAP